MGKKMQCAHSVTGSNRLQDGSKKRPYVIRASVGPLIFFYLQSVGINEEGDVPIGINIYEVQFSLSLSEVEISRYIHWFSPASVTLAGNELREKCEKQKRDERLPVGLASTLLQILPVDYH